MPTKSARSYSIALIIGDLFALSLAFTVAYIARVQFDPRPKIFDIEALDFFFTFLTVAPFWILVFASLGLYNSQVYTKRLTEIGKLLIGSCIGILIMLGYAFVVNEP